MFDQAFDCLKKATEASVQLQHEMLGKWLSFWPTNGAASGLLSGATFPVQQIQQRWTDTIGDLLKRQRDVFETSFKLGIENIERAFKLGEAKSPEELRGKTIEMWQQCLESVRKTNEIQMREFHAATEKWLNLLAKPVGV